MVIKKQETHLSIMEIEGEINVADSTAAVKSPTICGHNSLPDCEEVLFSILAFVVYLL